MLYYLLFWTILGFIFHFYIIFGTNLLTGGPAQNCCFFAYFSVSKKQNIKRSQNRKNPFWNVIFFSDKTQETWTLLQEVPEAVTRVGGAPPLQGAPPCLMGPSVLHRRTPSSYIYTRTPNDQNRSQKPNSTAATFCIHEIPSWGLFWSSAGRGPSSWRASTSS